MPSPVPGRDQLPPKIMNIFIYFFFDLTKINSRIQHWQK
jgi:hypothetical protein